MLDSESLFKGILQEKGVFIMASRKKQCPECKGKKVVPGTCECNMEWRGNQTDDGMEDCRCEDEVTCPTCNGTGEVAVQDAA